jgi:hypothetical protein
VLSTDGGAEFGGVFTAELATRGIGHALKDGPNSISIVDRGIQNLKVMLAKMMSSRRGTWQQLLQPAVQAVNKTPKDVLHHEAPADVLESDDVTFMLLQDNARKITHNVKLLETRKARLLLHGGMRTPTAGKSFKRGHEASYKDKGTIDHFEGSEAVQADGARIDVKHLKAVDLNSTEVVPRFGLKSNSVKINNQRRDSAEIYALSLEFLAGKERDSLINLARFLKERLRLATDTLAQIFRKTKLSLIDTLRLNPRFEVEENNRWVRRAPPGAPAPA